jgi:YegS/Rv2252/BmrU family lipid kinase
VSQPHTTVIVNPAAGGGKAARRAERWLAQLGPHTLVHTSGRGHATSIAQTTGSERIIAVGGDGTLFEVVNGLMRREGTRPSLGILPLGTGNSFVRDLGASTPEQAVDAIRADRRRPVDVLRLDCESGPTWSINLVSIGFTAEVGELANRRFKALGPAGYVAAVLISVGRLHCPTFPIRLDRGPLDDRACVFLSFSNSQYTGGQMHMAPSADISDGLVEVVRVGAMRRRRLLSAFPKIFGGTHVSMPEVEVARAREVAFVADEPFDLMIDGEILRALPRSLSVEPGAISVLA